MAQPCSAICKSYFLLAKIHVSLFSYWEACSCLLKGTRINSWQLLQVIVTGNILVHFPIQIFLIKKGLFKTLLKALGRSSLHHPPNWRCIVQLELWIFSMKADPTYTCGSRHHIQQDTPYLSIHPTLRHLTLFSDISNNSNWKSHPILTAYPHPGRGRHRLSEGNPSRTMLAKTLSGTRVWTVGQLRILGFLSYLYSSSCSSLASWSFNLNSSAVTLPFPSRSWLVNIFLTIFSKSKPGANFPLPVSTWVWMYSEN